MRSYNPYWMDWSNRNLSSWLYNVSILRVYILYNLDLIISIEWNDKIGTYGHDCVSHQFYVQLYNVYMYL